MTYTIRIELHNANASHYLDLAKKLAAIGVIDTIRADNGVIYKMPQRNTTLKRLWISTLLNKRVPA